ncbi:MAG: type I polyketide synthase [Chloroflexi bacterium]|nr:type I polyketide synthase [Chloroflexota bacterium]
MESGTDAVTDGRPGNGIAPDMRGAFIEGIEWFDSRFFRISPVEARLMDPQQRMMLETSWEALEDAGIDPDGLRGSQTGVYAGIGGSEYREVIESSGKLGNYLGTNASVAAGRIAFALGLEGPAMAIDMACASALAAVHQAVSGLQREEVDLALAGGVHVVLSPSVSDFMTELGMLSKSGKSSPFDASADGYVRGEGCGVLVLKRLSDAEADGDRIWGVIRGSAVNQNGASAGLTVPNGSAQERVMEAALKQAGFSGTDVDYLEAHATGSQLGDAIEAHAVGSVYGKGREAAGPLLMGTVKSNIGHLEAAAGVAGIIKTVLAMKQGVIPKHLHFESPNPQIEWGSMPVRITSEKTDWPECADRPPRAGVSAFGISGTNAHVVLEGYGSANANGASDSEMLSFESTGKQVPISMPERLSDLPVTGNGLEERSTRFLPLSGKSDGALRDLAAQYLSWLDEHDNGSSPGALTPQSLADAAWMASVGRSHFDYRTGVVFTDAASMSDGLAKVRSANGESDCAEQMAATRVAFLYTGDGSQWRGMGKSLYDSEPVARAVLDRCDAIVRAERGSSLLDAIFGRPAAPGDLGDAAWAQPALYALECALTVLWASIGIRPNTVFGQGTGEIAAAQAAGVFSLEDGLRFVLARSTLMAVLPGVDPNQSLKGLEVAFEDVEVSPPSLPMISGVTGRVIDSGNSLDGAYWSRQARASAELGICAVTLAELGVDTVIELGSKAVMGPQMREAWPVPSNSGESARTPLVIASMSEQYAVEAPVQSEGFIDAVARAYEAGMSISFEGMFVGESRRRISLHTYPFQRRRHWV